MLKAVVPSDTIKNAINIAVPSDETTMQSKAHSRQRKRDDSRENRTNRCSEKWSHFSGIKK
jgi:hypothetical protein